MLKEFDQKALQLFEEKGNGNAVKVRRISELTKKFSTKNFEDLRILDLGCGEGVYSLEAAMNGASVVAIDGRNNRLKYGEEVAKNHGLDKVDFQVDDVRNVTIDKYGKFDIIYNLGLLYHLDSEDCFSLLKRLYDMCDNALIIDTTIGLSSPLEVKHEGESYYGVRYVEHDEKDDNELVMNQRVMHSIGNNESFLPTKNSLIRFLNKLGFECIMECYSPIEPFKNDGRVTLIALKGEKSTIKSYPWINGLSEDEIIKRSDMGTKVPFVLPAGASMKQKTMAKVVKWLDKRGFELKRKLSD